MTKSEILDYFKDINLAYNDCTRLDMLSSMLDELLKEQPKIVRCKDCKHLFDGEHEFNCCDVLMDKARWITTLNVDPDWYCADGEAKQDD